MILVNCVLTQTNRNSTAHGQAQIHVHLTVTYYSMKLLTYSILCSLGLHRITTSSVTALLVNGASFADNTMVCHYGN